MLCLRLIPFHSFYLELATLLLYILYEKTSCHKLIKFITNNYLQLYETFQGAYLQSLQKDIMLIKIFKTLSYEGLGILHYIYTNYNMMMCVCV